MQGSPPSLVGSSSNPAATGKIFVHMVEPIPHRPFQSNQICISYSHLQKSFCGTKTLLKWKKFTKFSDLLEN